jgi:Short-chain dehydrogenases of various substrate specificities
VATQRVLIIGGGGGIGSAVARQLASEGQQIFLAGRDTSKLAAVAAATGAATAEVDATDFSAAEAVADQAVADLGGLTGIVCCAGSLL